MKAKYYVDNTAKAQMIDDLLTLKQPQMSWYLTVTNVAIVEYKRKVTTDMITNLPQNLDRSPLATISLMYNDN